MNKRYIVSKILLVDGILLIVLAFIHLFATPLINKWLAYELTARVLEQVSPAFLLNHIVVGILLIPFGISTLYSSIGVRAGQAWARGIAITNALAVMSMPLLVVMIMGPQYFEARVFLAAAVLVTVIGLTMILPLIWLWGDSRKGDSAHDHDKLQGLR
ncbi:MAG: hypothetical protein HY033_01320 [Ignavibacteriae bacterium]|nr:hypothetical protein [Ignavibacteria bacterium]MBI3363526.1 hypothetical protein [Ignavibacteriota bacterium]